MIRIASLFILITLASASSNATTGQTASVTPHVAFFAVAPVNQEPVSASGKDNKNNDLKRELENAAEPLLILKAAIESHLPQRELNTIRRMAFQILLMARRYL